MTYLTTEQLATRWSVHPGTLRNWRSQDVGPSYVKIGDGVRSPVKYDLQDVVRYEKKNRIKPLAG